jgi:hypothetical protein
MERSIEQAFGTDFRGLCRVVTDDGRAQFTKASRAGAERGSHDLDNSHA